MKIKKVVSILDNLRCELELNDVEIGEDISTKKIVSALDTAIEALKENKKLRKKNEKLKAKIKEFEEDDYERD